MNVATRFSDKAPGRAGALAMLGLAATLLAGTGAAADDSLYQAQVPVADASEAARIEALPAALSQVFSKWSGQRSVSSPAVAAELARAGEYVQRFRYREGERGGAGEGATASMLWVQFDASAVDAAIQRAGFATWSGQRPSPLLWVALKKGDGLDLIGPEADDALDRALLDAAWKRGLPLRLPLLDLEDRIKVKPEEVWAMNEAVLVEASARYPAGPLVSGRLDAEPGGLWRAQWRMRDAGESHQWRTRADSPAAALSAGVEELADRLVARYALASNTTEAVEFQVSGIRSLSDYGRLMSYLRGLGGVADVAVVETRGESMRFRLSVAGGADGLRRSVGFGGVLKADDAAGGYRLGP